MRTFLVLACSLGLACGSEEPSTEGGSGSETGMATAGSTGDDSDPTSASAGTMSGSATTGMGSNTDSGPSDSSGADESGTTDGCPAGTLGCPCDVGSTCDDGLLCNDDGLCEAPPACRPIDTEPHGDEASALQLDPVNCSNELIIEDLATLDAPETDWFRTFGDEGALFCSEQPRAIVTTDIDVEVCVYIECLEGAANSIGCAGGSMSADSPEGRPGCCGTNEAHLNDYECGGLLTPKNVDIWISVASEELACVDYDMTYSF